jgi:hypothetical protein
MLWHATVVLSVSAAGGPLQRRGWQCLLPPCRASPPFPPSPCARSFRKPAKKIPGKCGLRFYKNVGLGYKTPREAIEGERGGGRLGWRWHVLRTC